MACTWRITSTLLTHSLDAFKGVLLLLNSSQYRRGYHCPVYLCVAYRRSKHGMPCVSRAGASDPGFESPFKLQNATRNSYERTIVTARPCAAGSSIMAVAWPDALTAQDALQQLHNYDNCGRGRRTHQACL